MIKRYIYLFIIVLVLLCSAGCSKNVKNNKKVIDAEFVDKKWLFYNEIRGEHQIIRFESDGSFSFTCECGETDGDFDVYDQYKYSKKNETITIFNNDKDKKNIKVIDYNEYHLMLSIDGRIKDFVLGKLDNKSNFFSYEGEKYFKGYNSRCTIIDITDKNIVYGPNEYDPEGLYKDGPFQKYELADNVSIKELSIKRYLSIQGEQEYEEYYEVKHSKLTKKDIKFILDSGAGSAFVWFDDNLRVKKILFFGEVEVTADYITITVPAEKVGKITQRELDKKVNDGQFDVAKLNEDGSVFYLMDKEQYAKMKNKKQ